MFGIGAFARVADVSVRTLHHYDEIGLLRPSRADPRTGYRWYSAEQLPRLNRILALRDLGFALADIRTVVDDEVTVSELRGMLRLRRADAAARVAGETQRLARVEARLHLLERDDPTSDYDIVVKRLGAQSLAVARARVREFGNTTLGPVLGRAFAEVSAALARAGCTAAGPSVALYFDAADDDVPIEAVSGLPLEGGPLPDVEVLELPPVDRAATTVHRGSMANVEEGYAALLWWTEQTGEHVDGYGREVYLQCEDDPSTWVTELQLPLCPR